VQRGLRWAYWGYLAVLTVLLVVPFDAQLATGGAAIAPQLEGFLPTLGHLVFYAFAGMLAAVGAEPLRRAVAVVTGHGPLLELVQAGLPWRSCELGDAVADVLGVALGVLLVMALGRGRRSARAVALEGYRRS